MPGSSACSVGSGGKKEDRREHHSGGDKTADAAGYPFYCIHNKDPVQYMLTADRAIQEGPIEIWIDRKPDWKALSAI